MPKNVFDFLCNVVLNVKESAIVIDAGITRVDNKIRGDFKTETEDIIYTPVPNGVGVMTVDSQPTCHTGTYV